MRQDKPVIIVTGSSGLIGTAVCTRLGQNFDIYGFDFARPRPSPPNTHWLPVDLTSDDSVADAFTRVRKHTEKVASVIHLAAYYDFSGKPSDMYRKVTVDGTARMIRGLAGFETGQFVYSSTMLVHAPCKPGQHITEDWPLRPRWDYPRSKVKAEHLILKEHGDIPVVILRIAGVYDDRGHSLVLTHQLQRIFERRMTAHVFPGDVTHGQAFVHLDDVVDAVERCVERRGSLPAETTLLIGEPRTLSYDNIQRTFGRLAHNEEWITRRIAKPLAKTGAWLQDHLPFTEAFIKPWMIDLADDHYALDISRAREVLGWEPKHSLNQALPAMVGALKADPSKFYRQNALGKPPAGARARRQASQRS